ncbi:MAG: hypothetical protein QCI82_10715 [Candidatus Thermoplasmatota archaeon]|nr:hypothetical protein [Candidatus Thermoplasmatota archaeon]
MKGIPHLVGGSSVVKTPHSEDPFALLIKDQDMGKTFRTNTLG